MSRISTDIMGTSYFLIVDDQGFIRSLLQGMLVGLGARHIRSAANGEEALNRLSQSRINCVISDWNMTPMNGLELLRQVRMGTQKNVPASLPFILFTGYGDSSVISTAMNLDVSACLVKPASALNLGKAIKSSLSKKMIAKPSSYYARIEVNNSPHEDSASAGKASEWAKWVKDGRQEYSDGQVSHIDRKSIQLSGGAEDDGSPQLKNIRLKPLDMIKAGQVLVEDLNDEVGTPLLVAGTIINEKILRRLKVIEQERGDPLKLWVGRMEKPR